MARCCICGTSVSTDCESINIGFIKKKAYPVCDKCGLHLKHLSDKNLTEQNYIDSRQYFEKYSETITNDGVKKYIKTLYDIQYFSVYIIKENIFAIIDENNILSNLTSLNTKTININDLTNIKKEINDFIKESINKDLYMDKMTNVFNRNKYELDIKTRLKDEIWYIIADINNLKTTNDTLGHDKGDELIKDFTNLLKSIFDSSDIYRLGGDEFVILSKDSIDEKIKELQYLSKKINLEQNKNISYAIGFERYIPNQTSWELITKIADNKMYENKKLIKDNTNSVQI